MKVIVLLLLLWGGGLFAQTNGADALLDQNVPEDVLVAIGMADSLMKLDAVTLDEFVQMVDLMQESPADQTFRALRTLAQERVRDITESTPDVKNALRIWNEDLVYVGQDEEGFRFNLVFGVENLSDESILDFALMIAVYRPDGTDDWGSTGGEGYLDGKALAPGKTVHGLVFPIKLTIYEDDDPEGEYGTYATARILKAGGKEVVELTLFDIQTPNGWVLYPR